MTKTTKLLSLDDEVRKPRTYLKWVVGVVVCLSLLANGAMYRYAASCKYREELQREMREKYFNELLETRQQRNDLELKLIRGM